MKVSILNKILYRVPQFSNNALLSECWNELKASIKISSRDFYDEIKDVESGRLEELPLSIYKTIWKYFNRAKFRATPYGTFAGVGLATINSQGNLPSLIVEKKQNPIGFIDWYYKDHITLDVHSLIKVNGFLIANHSYYVIADVIRYLSHIDSKFELSEIGKDDVVMAILQACSVQIKIEDLKKKIISFFENEMQMIEGLDYLIELQLLFTSRHPNSIGDDYFQRLGINNVPALPQYIITQRNLISGAIDQNKLKNLPGLVGCLQSLSTSQTNKALEKFIADFQRKFEQQDITIMQALDPEVGIGYDELEQAGDVQELVVDILVNRQSARVNVDEKWRASLFSQLITNSNQSTTINLEGFPKQGTKNKLPNTFSAQLSDANGMLCLESLGGVTGNGLLGRFTMSDDSILDHTRSIAAIEIQANPDVLFFDISYLAEGQVDNINRRRSVYDLQLSILNYDTSLSPLTLDDLYLSVIGSELILKSKRLNKRLIPRLASAYNYNRSDLSVFRLLCDLQTQNIQPRLAFDLSTLVPDLPFYPRVQYKDIIVSRAKWKVTYEDLDENCRLDIEAFRFFLNGIGIKNYFKTGNADQTLCFDPSIDIDLFVFRDFVKRKGVLYVDEAFVTDHTIIKDENNAPYNSEFIVTLYHQEQLYRRPKIKHQPLAKGNYARIIPPGNDWLYFEIFSHPQKADRILLDKIAELIRIASNQIKQWFFIRYNENGNHIRLRIRMYQSADAFTIVQALSSLLNEEIQSGIVSDFALKTYKRELERYGHEAIERIEEHFHKDSAYVMELLKAGYESYHLYALSISIVSSIRASAIFEIDQFDDLLRRITSALAAENHTDINGFKRINATYKSFKNVINPKLDVEQRQCLNIFYESFAGALTNCDMTLRMQLFADLMHMHINRLFNTDQRVHEFLIYCFLEKELKETSARRLQRA